MSFNWDELPPEVQRRLAASNPELATELHQAKRQEQLVIARLNRVERERIKREKEQQIELEKEFEIGNKYIQGVIKESDRKFAEAFAFLHEPIYHYEEPTLWERICSWFKRKQTA